MFSAAVSVGTRLNDWNTKPMWSRRIWVRLLSSSFPMSKSPTNVWPEVGPVEAGHAVHQGGLARARRAHDGREAAALEGHVDAGQGVHRRLSGPVGLAQVDGVRGQRRPFARGERFRR